MRTEYLEYVFEFFNKIYFWSALSGFIGTVLIFFFGLPPSVNKEGHINLILEQTDQKEAKKYHVFRALSYLGISLLALSFILQIISYCYSK